LAVIAITLTIVAIATPVSFMGGIAGQYQAVRHDRCRCRTVFAAVARLITPMMAAY
jgi:multidrug efflux pump subunit AcrB